MLLYLVLQDVNYCIRLGFACSTRPHNNRAMLYDFRFVLMLVCFSAQIFCRRLARSTHKLDFPFSNFGFLVLHSHKRYVMFKCIAVLANQDRARDPISVAYFNQVALFSDFNDLFELLGPGFAPYSSSAFYILELSSKNILKTLAVNSMNNFHVVLTHVAHTKPLSRMQSLSVSRGRSKVTKPIFSNSAMRYFKIVCAWRTMGRGKKREPLSFPSSPACFNFASSRPVTKTVIRGGETSLQFLVYVSIKVSQYYNLPH